MSELIFHTTQSHLIILMFLSVLHICQTTYCPPSSEMCATGHTFLKMGGSKLLKIHYSNCYFVCLQIGRAQGQLRMISHCRGYMWSPTKSCAFRDSAQWDLQISTATCTIKCKPIFHSLLTLLLLYTLYNNTLSTLQGSYMSSLI
jgi:hypothetical protein